MLGVALALGLVIGWALMAWREGGTPAPVLGPAQGPVTTPTAPPGFVPPGEEGRTLLDGFDEIAITVRSADGGDPCSGVSLRRLPPKVVSGA